MLTSVSKKAKKLTGCTIQTRHLWFCNRNDTQPFVSYRTAFNHLFCFAIFNKVKTLHFVEKPVFAFEKQECASVPENMQFYCPEWVLDPPLPMFNRGYSRHMFSTRHNDFSGLNSASHGQFQEAKEKLQLLND